MKKFFALSAFVFAAAVIFSSCKKDFTCDCKDSDGTQVATASGKASNKDAKETCDALETSTKTVYPDASCELK